MGRINRLHEYLGKQTTISRYLQPPASRKITSPCWMKQVFRKRWQNSETGPIIRCAKVGFVRYPDAR
jgi:hypothetical protein